MAIDWADFFEFSTGNTFDIIEEDGLLNGGADTKLGDGKVIEINGNKLVLEFNIPSQTIDLSGLLDIFVDSVDVPEITSQVSITILNLGDGNQLEVSGTYIDSDNVTQSFNYTDSDLEARLRNGGDRIRLNASDSFLDTISSDSNIDRLGRLEFEKTGDSNTTEIDIGRLPLGTKIDIFLERN